MAKRGLIYLFLCFALFAYSGSKTRLGDAVNSVYVELTPVISPDNSTLFFARQGDPSNAGYKEQRDDQDIWMSKRDITGAWQPARRIDAYFNNKMYNYPIAASADGRTLYMSNTYNRDGSTGKGISWSRYEGGRWSFPVALKIDNYYNNSPYSTFSIGADETTMIMAVVRNDSYGKEDLYVSFRTGRDRWSKPKNLGYGVNSKNDETTPYLAPDGRTLYFSSNRPEGEGAYDIYVTRRLDESWQRWSKPRNLGRRINTPGNDFYFIVGPTGDYSMLVSKGDIYRIDLPRRVQPDATALIWGKVLTSDNKPISSRVRYERLRDGKQLGQTFSDGKTGEFKLVLPRGEMYGVRAERAGYLSVNQSIKLYKAGSSYRMNLVLSPVKKGSEIRLNNVFFEKGSARITRQSFHELNRLVKILRKNRQYRVQISGHTDSKGKATDNRALSLKRAQAVRAFLVSKGIKKKRIRSLGYGSSKPLANNKTESGRKMNRRVEIKLL